MRPALNRQQAEELITEIPSIDTIAIADEKTLEKTYKDLIHSSDPKALVSLIKTIHLRKEKRLLKGFKVTALDSRYFKQAEDFLYGELSVALDIPRNEVRDYICERCE
jgi:CarD family transcriptional regulator